MKKKIGQRTHRQRYIGRRGIFVRVMAQSIPASDKEHGDFSHLGKSDRIMAVSYTHLTLPTICSV